MIKLIIGIMAKKSEFQKECRGTDTKEGVYKINRSEIEKYL